MQLTRREAICKMAVLMGAAVAGPRLLAATLRPGTPAGYTAADLALLDEIGEAIIPGAKATGIGAFIAMMVNDCCDAPAQAAFKTGLARLPTDYEARYGEKFIGGRLENRAPFLNALDAEQRKHTAQQKRRPAGTDEEFHFFRLMRELTILGYFTSEIGSTKTLHYLEVPGRYDGNVPYKKGDEWFI